MNLLHKSLSVVEVGSQFLQGKGYGGVKKEVKALKKLLGGEKPELVLDVGGNTGSYSAEILSHFPDCDLVVFEPSQSNYKRLVDRFNDNKNVKIERFALSNESKKSTLFSDADGSGLASLSNRRLDHMDIDFTVRESVDCIKFDDYWEESLENRTIDVMKLDIEGHELSALDGMASSLEKTAVVQFEFGGCNIDSRTYFQDFWYFFNTLGFQIFRISPLGLAEISHYREVDETFRMTNFLARKND